MVGPATYAPDRTLDYAPRWREHQTWVELRDAGADSYDPPNITRVTGAPPPVWVQHRRRAVTTRAFGLRQYTRDDKPRLIRQLIKLCGASYTPPGAWFGKFSVDDVGEILRIVTAARIEERARVEDWYR